MLTKCHSYKNNVFIEFIVKSKPFFSKNSIKIFFDKFDKFFDKWTPSTYVQRGSKFCFVVVLLLLVVGKSLIKLASLAVY
jgi:hypothetical protein